MVKRTKLRRFGAGILVGLLLVLCCISSLSQVDAVVQLSSPAANTTSKSTASFSRLLNALHLSIAQIRDSLAFIQQKITNSLLNFSQNASLGQREQEALARHIETENDLAAANVASSVKNRAKLIPGVFTVHFGNRPVMVHNATNKFSFLSPIATRASNQSTQQTAELPNQNNQEFFQAQSSSSPVSPREKDNLWKDLISRPFDETLIEQQNLATESTVTKAIMKNMNTQLKAASAVSAIVSKPNHKTNYFLTPLVVQATLGVKNNEVSQGKKPFNVSSSTLKVVDPVVSTQNISLTSSPNTKTDHKNSQKMSRPQLGDLSVPSAEYSVYGVVGGVNSWLHHQRQAASTKTPKSELPKEEEQNVTNLLSDSLNDAEGIVVQVEATTPLPLSTATKVNRDKVPSVRLFSRWIRHLRQMLTSIATFRSLLPLLRAFLFRLAIIFLPPLALMHLDSFF